MITINVPDMKCQHCVKSITDALTAADLTFTVSLDNHTVVIEGCQNCATKAVSAMTELGFTPEIQK